MLLKVEKNVHDLKIGVVGSRASCFTDVLEKNKINYNLIKVKDIDDSYDLVFESGLYKIIPADILNKPSIGVIGTHETPLPEGQGFAPIQWSVLNRRKHLVVTLYKLDPGVDSGRIINQINKPITRLDTIKTLDNKRKEAISEAFQLFIDEIEQGYIVLREQTGTPSYSPRRTPDSCELDVNKNLEELWDEIRICDNEKYPAWFRIDGKKIIIRYTIT
jgi:methionyl-tRNA formyltransferase